MHPTNYVINFIQLKGNFIMSRLSYCLGTLSLLLFSLPLFATVLQVSITGVDVASGGYIMVGVYESQATFLKADGRIAQARLPVTDAKAGIITTQFELPGGKTYAVAAYHDANSNKKLDANFFGIPQEGYGCTNNARGTLGPPSFDDAAILLNKDNQLTSFYLSY
jgi:uncharacterized protein (DUF2141 family)